MAKSLKLPIPLLFSSVALAGLLASCAVRSDREPPGTQTAPKPTVEAPTTPPPGVAVTAPIETAGPSTPVVNDETPVAKTPVLDWAAVNAKVFSVSCMKCHAAPRNAAGINLESYASVKAALDAISRTVFVEASMPPRGPMPDESIAFLKAWIDAGAPETVGAVAPTPAAEPTTPATPIAPLSPAAPVVPETPIVPTTPEAPAAPVTPVVPAAPVTPAAPTPVDPIVPPAATTPVIDWAYVNTKVISVSCVKCHAAPRNSGGVNLESYASVISALADINRTVLIEASMPPRGPMPDESTAILRAWLDAGAPETVPAAP